MSREEIFEILKGIIVDKLGVDGECVCEASEFENDFGADSLDAVELIMEAEKLFGIYIEDDTAERIKTVEDAVDYIKKYM